MCAETRYTLLIIKLYIKSTVDWFQQCCIYMVFYEFMPIKEFCFSLMLNTGTV